MHLTFRAKLTFLALVGGLFTTPGFAAIHCNTGAITIPEEGAGNPYPSSLTVSGEGALLTDVNLAINGFSHTWPNDAYLLLVGPQGQNLVILGNTGGATDAVDANLTFDDAAAGPILGAIVSGTYQRSAPGNLPAFPSPAPADSGATALSTFNSTDPNGNWDLYAFDNLFLDAGVISGGWCLEVTSSSPPPGGAQPVPALGPVGLVLLSGLLGLGVFFNRRRG